MSMNVSLSNRRSQVEDTHGAQSTQQTTPTTGTTGVSRPTQHAQPSVVVGQGPSEQSRRLEQAAGTSRQCAVAPQLSMRADEGTIETYRRSLAQGRTPAAPPPPPPLPTASNAQLWNGLVRSLPANHPLRAALSQVSWQDSNRPPISDFVHRVMIPSIAHLLPEGHARALAEHVMNFLYPDFTGGTVAHHAGEHVTHEAIEEAVHHYLEHHGLLEGAAGATRNTIMQVVSKFTMGLHLLDSVIMTGRELSRLARGEVIPTQAIVDAQRTQEVHRARTQFDDGVRAAVHGNVDCARMATDRCYSQGVDAGSRYRQQHGEAFAAQARHNEAITVARQRNLSSVNADVRMLTAGPERSPADAQSDAINRALLAE